MQPFSSNARHIYMHSVLALLLRLFLRSGSWG